MLIFVPDHEVKFGDVIQEYYVNISKLTKIDFEEFKKLIKEEVKSLDIAEGTKFIKYHEYLSYNKLVKEYIHDLLNEDKECLDFTDETISLKAAFKLRNLIINED